MDTYELQEITIESPNIPSPCQVIPVFHPDEEFQPKLIEMQQGETSPPALLTEADLIALMDKHGIGTDATHAEHIETIKARLYVGVRDDGRFVPGELGMGLVEGMACCLSQFYTDSFAIILE